MVYSQLSSPPYHSYDVYYTSTACQTERNYRVYSVLTLRWLCKNTSMMFNSYWWLVFVKSSQASLHILAVWQGSILLASQLQIAIFKS